MAITNNKRVYRVLTIFAIATVLGGVALTVYTQQNRIWAGYFFNEGVITSLRTDYYKAIKYYIDIEEIDYFYKEAIEDYDRAIELNSNFARAYYKRGQVKFRQKQYKAALDDYKKAQKLSFEYTKSANFYNELGNVYFYLNNFKTAIDNYNQAIKINSKNADFYNDRGFAYLRTNEYENAIKDYTQAWQLKINTIFNKNRGDAFPYFGRGNAYSNQGDYKAAIACYTLGLHKLSSSIGVELEVDPETKVLKVVKPIENSPAWKQGVKAGDKILLIDGKDTINTNVSRAKLFLLRGEAGTKVTLRIARQGRSNFDITLTRVQMSDPIFAKSYQYRGETRFALRDKQGAIEDAKTAQRLFSEKGDAVGYKRAQELLKKLQQ